MKRRLPYERSIPLMAILSAVPAVVIALIFIWTAELAARLQWTLSLLIGGTWVGFLLAMRERLIRPLQIVSNMIAALQEGDYSLRARLGQPEDTLGLVAFEINTLGETLREQRLEVLEATALLRNVMAQIDVAVVAFDAEDRLVFANRAAERLLDRPEEILRRRTAEAIGLAPLLTAASPQVLDHTFPGGSSRWEVRISTFRQDGRPHRLLVISDLSRVLRDEERKAWQRLVRVLSHEINNSLAPIQSIAQSLSSIVDRSAGNGGTEWRDDVRDGLGVISGRSEALGRFMSSYARLARLPRPRAAPLAIGDWIDRVVGLETRIPVEVVAGPQVMIDADGDQLEQLMINLIDNAVDAAAETDGGVRVGWAATRRHVEVWVEDDGPGIADGDNLFVPFYTTKTEGSGIGLVLSRQIAEAHHGTLALENRAEGAGAVARLRLPRARKA